MPSTSYLARVIIRDHASNTTVAGSYALLVKAKTIPSPLQPPNTVESTTLEDDAQTFEEGIHANGAIAVTGNLEKESLDSVTALAGKTCDIFFLLGKDGLGGVAKYYFQGTVSATPSDVGGVDSILEMTATIIPKTVPALVTDDYTITVATGVFTVAAAS